jgi:hypothetical protein
MNKKNSLEGNLSFKECGESLKLMKNVKSPGSDGFTVDFYKFFWNDIFTKIFRASFPILMPIGPRSKK